MATELATAYVTLALSTKKLGQQIESGLRVGDGAAARAGQSAGSHFSSGFSKTFDVAKKVSLGLGTLIGAAGGFGLKIAAQNEQAQISFTTMLGSAQKAGAFLKDLQKFAAATPFEFPELQTAASSLISAGFQAKQVIPIMRTLGDVTAGMGTGSEGIQRATIALQQMSAAGKISGEDLNQLRDAGIPVYDLLAKATGKAKDEIVMLAQKGKLGKKELTQMIDALSTGKGLERFSGLMDKQSQSLTGLLSTFKDTLGQGLANTMKPVIPLIKDGLLAASNELARVLPQVAKGLLSMTTHVGSIKAGFQGLTDLIFKGDFTGKMFKVFHVDEDSNMVDMVLTARDAIKPLLDSVGNLHNRMSGLGSPSGPIASTVGFLARMVVGARGLYDLIVKGNFSSYFRKAFNLEEDSGTVTFLLGVHDTLSKIVTAVKNFNFKPIGDFFKGLAAGGGDSTLSKIGDSFKALGPLLANIVTTLPAATPAINTFSTVMGFLADHVDLLVKIMPALLAVFATYKVLQAANNVIGRESVIGFAAQIATTSALAASNFALSRSQKAVKTSAVEANVAENVGLLTRVRTTVATIASTVAQKAAAVATKVFAAGQWLLNAALTANPIGLVIAAIAGLIAIVVIAYKKNETFRNIVNAVWAGIKKGIGATVEWFKNTAWPWMRDAMQWIGDKGKWLWEKVLSPAFSAIKTGIGKVKDAFKTAASNISTEWGKLEGYAKKPIKFVIETVLNRGLIGGFNWLSSKIGGPHIDPIPLPKGFATGGVLPGYTPGRDVHSFYSPTGGRLDLSGGEAIMRPEFTRLVGGKRGVERLNQLARRGYAGGGIIDWIKSKGSSAFNWLTDKASAVYKAVTNPAKFLRDRIPAIPGSDILSEYASGAKNRLVGAAVDKIKSLFKVFQGGHDEAFGSGIGKNARGWAQLWAIVHKLLPSIMLTSAFRPGSITASGNLSYHALGRAIDVAPPSMGAFEKIRSAFPNATELIYSPAGGRQLKNGRPYVYSGAVKDMHYNHIHLAMAKGGIIPKPLLFDSGGVLPTGTSLVHNGTGAPEPLVRADRGNLTVYMTVSVDDLAKLNKLDDFLRMLDSERVRQRKVERSGVVSA